MGPARLGHSEIAVSRLALGSWRTLEHLSREEGTALLAHAVACGVTFFDDARYDDKSGDAPIPTGWSEVLFGECFRAAGIPRDGVVVSNKLWWEFWPRQRAVEELESSLERMGFAGLDLLYATPPPEEMSVAEAVEEMAAVMAGGKVRTWGVLNWSAVAISEATTIAPSLGIEPPSVVQLPYNLVYRRAVEDTAMEVALEQAGAALVPAAPLAGGTLTGKYAVDPRDGRMAGKLERPAVRAAQAAAADLRSLADRLGCSNAGLALAFTLLHPRTASTLFGARTPSQIDTNLEASAVLERLGADEIAELRTIGSAP
jgi:L-glyceraldehyde 3-phosphate reductase